MSARSAFRASLCTWAKAKFGENRIDLNPICGGVEIIRKMAGLGSTPPPSL